MNISNEDLKKKFGKKILNNEKLSNYSWFNLGGPAEILFKPYMTIGLHTYTTVHLTWGLGPGRGGERD